MKKYLPYLILLVVVGSIMALLFLTNKKEGKKVFDQRITLSKKDKIPYGTFVAFNSLKEMFPKARLYPSKEMPGFWDSLSMYDSKQAYVFIGDKLGADEYEVKKLIRFAESGNDVFISARYISAAADKLLGCTSSSFDLDYLNGKLQDSMKLRLSAPPFTGDSIYQYPGLTYSTYFSETDTTTTDVLGYDELGRINFIHLAAGKGHLYVHLEPLAFSNYFLLHKKNISYFEKIFSSVNPQVEKIVWDEYYVAKARKESSGGSGGGSGSRNNNRNDTKGWFSVLMNMKNENGDKSFRAAFWLLILLVAVYTLMEMRRKQRYIPVEKKPKNDSLDFVKTIGRLYYDRGDHLNLCHKMGAYFLEHVRGRYKIPTNILDEKFIKTLQYKSGAAEFEIRGIVAFIKYLEENPPVGEAQLREFYELLETFYTKA